jgi:hypothetical protein
LYENRRRKTEQIEFHTNSYENISLEIILSKGKRGTDD